MRNTIATAPSTATLAAQIAAIHASRFQSFCSAMVCQ